MREEQTFHAMSGHVVSVSLVEPNIGLVRPSDVMQLGQLAIFWATMTLLTFDEVGLLETDT